MMERTEASAIVKVSFDGDDLEVVRKGERAFVVVRRVCEVLTLGLGAQQQKLRAAPWAIISMIDMIGANGKRYETMCLDIECLGMWLATINPRKVGNAALRPKLIRYQIDATRVLNDLFFGRLAAPILGPDLSHAMTRLDDIANRLEPHVALAKERVRVGENSMAHDMVYGAIAAAAEILGWTWQAVHGLIRKEYNTPGYLSMSLREGRDACEFLKKKTANTKVGRLARQLTLWPGGA